MLNDAQGLLDDGDRDAIADLVAQAQAAQADREALLALHSHGAVIVNLAGRRVLGREAFDRALTAALASPLADVRTEVTIDDIRAPLADVAVVSCTKTVHDDRSSPDEPAPLPRTGALTYVLLRVAQHWRIVLAQTTPVLGA
jgi:uncharacterized protein (TIGR02246 family)